MTKHLNIDMDENNWTFLHKIRREIMIENNINIPLNQMMEYCLVDLRKNNTTNEIKEKFITNNRKGREVFKTIIENL